MMLGGWRREKISPTETTTSGVTSLDETVWSWGAWTPVWPWASEHRAPVGPEIGSVVSRHSELFTWPVWMDGWGALTRSLTQGGTAGSTWWSSGGRIVSGSSTSTWRGPSTPSVPFTGMRTVEELCLECFEISKSSKSIHTYTLRASDHVWHSSMLSSVTIAFLCVCVCEGSTWGPKAVWTSCCHLTLVSCFVQRASTPDGWPCSPGQHTERHGSTARESSWSQYQPCTYIDMNV